jgi:hypothetical protein
MRFIASSFGLRSCCRAARPGIRPVRFQSHGATNPARGRRRPLSERAPQCPVSLRQSAAAWFRRNPLRRDGVARAVDPRGSARQSAQSRGFVSGEPYRESIIR